MKTRQLAWGAKVTEPFRTRVIRIASFLETDPSFLMACMAFETGGTFSPSIRNAAGSGAVGLIQFMPQTALALGTTSEALARMSAFEQLLYVESYFRPRRGKLKKLSDVYMAILWPGAIGTSFPCSRTASTRSTSCLTLCRVSGSSMTQWQSFRCFGALPPIGRPPSKHELARVVGQQVRKRLGGNHYQQKDEKRN